VGAAEGSGRTGAGGAGARGAFLLAVALVLGVVLLQKFDETEGGGTVDAGAPIETTTTRRGASVSVAPPTTARALRPPEQVKVLVANGTGTSGLAGNVTNLLKGSNYNVLSPVDATKLVDITLVEYQPDFEAEARAIVTFLALPGSALRPMEDSPPVNDARAADILVIAGPDLKLPGEGGAATPTTRR